MRKFLHLLLLISLLGCEVASARARKKPRVLTMRATAFARAKQDTASGTDAREGIVAADPKVLPMGTRIRVEGAGTYDGEYLVTDTGAAVKGSHIDLYMNSAAEAKQFGTKKVRVTIREVGEGKADAREKEQVEAAR